MRGRWSASAYLAALLVIAGCAGGDSTVEVSAWQLCAATSPCETPTTIEVPATFDESVVPNVDYRMAAAVALPEALRGQDLTFAIPYFLASADLVVDGETLNRSDGRRYERYRSTGPLSWNIPAELTERSSLALELIVEHRWQQSAWLLTVPRLAPTAAGVPWIEFSRVFNEWTASIGLGVLLTISFCSLVLFWSERSLRVYASLAVQTATTASYPLFVLGWGQVLAGRYDMMAMAVLLLGASTAAIFTTHFGTGLSTPSRRWVVPMLVCTPLLAIGYDGFSVSYFEGPIIVAFVGGATTYQLVVLGRLFRKNPGDFTVQMHLLSWAVFLPFFPTEAALWLGLGDWSNGLRLGSLGVIGYALVHFVGISRTLILHRNTSDRLAADLESKVANIEHLNTELRRQIAERSRELSVALSRVDGERPARLPRPGDIVEDRYKIESQVGAGAMGAVFRVRRLSDNAELAMKVLVNVRQSNMARFARESQLISEIHHPNVVSVFDISIAADGLLYMVMEYVRGASLKKCAQRFGDLPWARAVLRGLAAGLREIHARGVVHRDIKPDNVVVSDIEGTAPDVKITDFGISTAVDPLADPGASSAGSQPPAPAEVSRTSMAPPVELGPSTVETLSMVMSSPMLASGAKLDLEDLTQTGSFLGTPYYMAPERFAGAEASASADIYAFGIIAFELLAGERPFPKPELFEMLKSRKQPALEDLLQKAPSLSHDIAEVVVAALAEDPTERPSADDFLRVLDGERPTSIN